MVKRVTPKEFGKVVAKPGTKEQFLVVVGELPTGSEVGIPVTVVSGKQDGPRVYVGSGSHTEETSSIDAVKRFAAWIRPDDINGTLILVPLQNPPAWAFRSTLYPLDAPTSGDVGVGGLTSGDPTGMMTPRVLSALADSIATNINFAFELRSTHLDSINYPFTSTFFVSNEPDDKKKKRLELAHKLGNELIRNRPGKPGGVLWILDSRGAMTTSVEAGEGWRNLEPFPSINIRAIRNFCKAIGAMKGELELPQMQVEYSILHDVTSNHGGMSHVYVRPGQYVRRGDIVGEVRDMFDNVVDELKAPANGIVGRCTLLPVVGTGGRICNIAETDRGDEWERRVVPELERQIGLSGTPRRRD